ncbi:MAG TPA: DASS family sodium-coupled anion symporter [Anaeromyxobacteraceae bacterium]
MTVAVAGPQSAALHPAPWKDLWRSTWRVAVPLIAAAAIVVIPPPPGLSHAAFHYFALFVAVILGLILEPMPAAAIGVLGITYAAVAGLPFSPAQLADPRFSLPAEGLRWALSGFSNGTVWLIFGAYMFALGYEKTGLGRRLALLLTRKLGRRTLGLGYAIAFADLALAPFTPSNTARSGGTIFPIIQNIPALYGSKPGETARRIGSYVLWTAFAVQAVTSAMFLTALAPNLLAVELIKKTSGIEISWAAWFVGFFPIGLALLLALPLVAFLLYPPEIKASEEVSAWAAEEYAKLGRVHWPELVMAALVAVALGLWIFGKSFIDPTVVALPVISGMVMTGIVKWDDIIGNKAAWNVLVWFATLVTLADGLNKVGFVGWFAKGAAGALSGIPPLAVMVVLVALFFLVHYLFASSTAHTTAVLPVVFAAGLAVPGLPARTFALLLCFSLGLMGVITPYATGPAPVYYGSGYVPRRDFWRLGGIFGALFLLVLLAVGVPYLMLVKP